MQERLKIIREHFGMTQAEFAKKLGVGQSTLAMMEVSKRVISDRHIKTICAICNVNEEWLRNGKGEMKNMSGDELFLGLKAQFDSEDTDIEIIKTYMRLPLSHKKPIRDHIQLLVDHENTKYLNSLEERQERIQNGGEPAAEEILEALSTEEQADKFAAIARKQFISEKKQEAKVSFAKESDAG